MDHLERQQSSETTQTHFGSSFPERQNLGVENIAEETLLMWDSVNSQPYFHDDEEHQLEKALIIVRVFTGGSGSLQEGPFTSALSLFLKTKQVSDDSSSSRILVEYIGVNEVCKKRWTSSNLIDWLLHSDVHFVLAHVHQGISSHSMEWNMCDTKAQLMRLKYHRGFPNGEQLACPVFTQDKIGYLKSLGDFANETWIAPLNQSGAYGVEFIDSLRRYIEVFILTSLIFIIMSRI